MRDLLAIGVDATRLRAQAVYQHLRGNGRDSVVRERSATGPAQPKEYQFECEQCAVRWVGVVNECWLCGGPGTQKDVLYVVANGADS